jgi:acetyl esterase/lipase
MSRQALRRIEQIGNTLNSSPASQPDLSNMTTKLAYNKEFAEAIKHLPSIQIPTLATVQETRAVINNFTQAATAAIPLPDNITETKIPLTTRDGTALEILRFDPPAQSTTTTGPGPQPCIAFLHGGGFFALSTEIFRPLYILIAAMTSRPVFGIPYRLAPEHPFPTPLDDVMDSITYISTHATALSIDTTRIALLGQSAGACLAVGAALRLRDEGFKPPIAKLVLQQPVLDDRTTLAADHPKNALLVWSRELNEMSWGAYLGRNGSSSGSGGEVSEYAAPARAKSFKGLPPVHVDTGSLDLFGPEVVATVARMVADDVEVELHHYAGVPHGFDGVAPMSSAAKDATEKRTRALMDF